MFSLEFLSSSVGNWNGTKGNWYLSGKIRDGNTEETIFPTSKESLAQWRNRELLTFWKQKLRRENDCGVTYPCPALFSYLFIFGIIFTYNSLTYYTYNVKFSS